MALEPDEIPQAVDDFIAEHEPTRAAAPFVDHAATPAHLATAAAYRALGRHIAAMGGLVLRDPWDDAGLAAMDREVCRLAHDIEQAKARMLLLRDCQGAAH